MYAEKDHTEPTPQLEFCPFYDFFCLTLNLGLSEDDCDDFTPAVEKVAQTKYRGEI